MKRFRSWAKRFSKSDWRLVAGVGIMLLATWQLGRIVFWTVVALGGLAVIYVAIFAGEEGK